MSSGLKMLFLTVKSSRKQLLLKKRRIMLVFAVSQFEGAAAAEEIRFGNWQFKIYESQRERLFSSSRKSTRNEQKEKWLILIKPREKKAKKALFLHHKFLN